MCVFFFSSRRRHTRLQGDWSSDVCSSDLCAWPPEPRRWTGSGGRLRDPGRAEATCYSEVSSTRYHKVSMKIHEYQAKGILGQYSVPVPRGEVAFTADEAEVAAKGIGGSVVVKAQIHAGGRGKGGGVKIARDAAEAAEIARKMLGMKLVTHQTGPEGRIVQRLLIEETLPIARELYLGIVLDRAQGKPVFMASAAGGMEIEEVAAKM